MDAGVTVSGHMYVHVRAMKESEVDLALVRWFLASLQCNLSLMLPAPLNTIFQTPVR